jgi:hypothetical protein
MCGALPQSASVPEWHIAAWRFKGLCAAFGFVEPTDLAERATYATKGDPVLLSSIAMPLLGLARQEGICRRMTGLSDHPCIQADGR